MGLRMLSSATVAYYDNVTIWTSTEVNNKEAFYFHPGSISPSRGNKDYLSGSSSSLHRKSYNVRPVLEF